MKENCYISTAKACASAVLQTGHHITAITKVTCSSTNSCAEAKDKAKKRAQECAEYKLNKK
jgi:hypothetical protein